jgi:hypothetical protein
MEAALVEIPEIPPIPIKLESQVNLPTKRGRKPKPKQTCETSSEIGRPPLATKVLVDDPAVKAIPTVRRSVGSKK